MPLLIIRRIDGHSMEPTLKSGKITLASSLKKPKPGRIVIAKKDGIEIIKRVKAINAGQMFLVGDNKNPAHNARVPLRNFVATKLFS